MKTREQVLIRIQAVGTFWFSESEDEPAPKSFTWREFCDLAEQGTFGTFDGEPNIEVIVDVIREARP